MTVYGYARVSTKKQSLERQIINFLKACPDLDEANIVKEKATGTRVDCRTQFKRLLSKVKAGDTILFDSVSRMSRNAAEGFELYQDLYSKGVNLVFIKEPYINTDNYRKAMHLDLPAVSDDCLKPLMEGLEKTLLLLAERQFKAAFDQAEKEVLDTRQRIKEGMAEKESGQKISAALAGKSRRSPKRDKAKQLIKRLSKDFDGNLSDQELMPLVGASRNSFYRYKRELKTEIL